MLSFWPGPGVNLLAGAGVYPRHMLTFGRGREGPGVVILAGAGARSTTDVNILIKNIEKYNNLKLLNSLVWRAQLSFS